MSLWIRGLGRLSQGCMVVGGACGSMAGAELGAYEGADWGFKAAGKHTQNKSIRAFGTVFGSFGGLHLGGIAGGFVGGVAGAALPTAAMASTVLLTADAVKRSFFTLPKPPGI